jgi:hypothetical protein
MRSELKFTLLSNFANMVVDSGSLLAAVGTTM